MAQKVFWTKKVAKTLATVPSYIRDKLAAWVFVVENLGIAEARKCSGFHDEPLKGSRIGQRSIRLNKAYRAIYVEQGGDCVEVIKVTKHEY